MNKSILQTDLNPGLLPMAAYPIRAIVGAAFLSICQVNGQTVVDLNSLPEGTRCTEKIVLLREERPGQIFRPLVDSLDLYHPHADSIGTAIFSKFQDNFDFILHTTQGYNQSAASLVRNTVQGIGWPVETRRAWNTISKRVGTVAEVGTYSRYQTHLNLPNWTSYRKKWVGTAIHELAHRWCCFGKGFYPDNSTALSAHYHSGIVFNGQNSEWIDPLQNDVWISTGSNAECGSRNDSTRITRFSDFTQYVMGLIPPEQVQPALLRTWDTTLYQKAYGPGCTQSPDFLNEQYLTVDDYIRLNGPRIPSAAESQKDFNVLPILILPYGVALDEDFAAFFQEMLDTLPAAWASATGGRSRLSLGCDLFDGASVRKGVERPGLDFRFDGHSLLVSIHQVISGTFRIDLLTLDGRQIGNLYAGNPPRGTLRLGLEQVGRGPLASGAFLVRIRAGEQEYFRKVSSIAW